MAGFVQRTDAGHNRGIPRWGLLSSALAPVLLIGGWTLAAAVQPVPFRSLRDTISQLAAVGMPHRYVMTLGLAGLGLCHLATAAALRPVAMPGRAVLALGGLCTALVATNPLPAHGGSAAHTTSAALAFVALSVWPALAGPRGVRGVVRAAGPLGPLDARVRAGVALSLLGLLVWFFWTLQRGSADVGLSERVTAGAQALWPLAVVLALRARSGRQAGSAKHACNTSTFRRHTSYHGVRRGHFAVRKLPTGVHLMVFYA